MATSSILVKTFCQTVYRTCGSISQSTRGCSFPTIRIRTYSHLSFHKGKPPQSQWGFHLKRSSWKLGGDPKRPRKPSKISLSPSNVSQATSEKISGYRWFLRPVGFTVVFTGCSFVTAAIWQYENMRRHALSLWQKNLNWAKSTYSGSRQHGGLKEKIMQYWNRLSEGEKVAAAIIALNSLVFAAWYLPALTPFMVRYFCSNPAAKAVCWPMILSSFSHYSFFHFAINMYVLFSFSNAVVNVLGKEQFVAFYLSAGVVASLASYIHKIIVVKPVLSLGASGCLMGVLGLFCMQYPNAKLSIVFLPMFPFTAGMALKAIIFLDAAGIAFGWKVFDHAAHLGGVLFGIAYSEWGRNLIWGNREPLMRLWGQIRGGPH